MDDKQMTLNHQTVYVVTDYTPTVENLVEPIVSVFSNEEAATIFYASIKGDRKCLDECPVYTRTMINPNV